MKIILFISIILTLLQFSLSCTGVNTGITRTNVSNKSQSSVVRKLIEQFRESKGNKIKINNTINDFVTLSSESTDFRQEAIQELLRIVYKFRVAKTEDQYNLWYGAVITLGELKAVEAVITLGDCLGCNNLISGFVLERYPSAYAITKIGSPAVPKLLQILTEDSKENEANRALAVLSLSRINETQRLGIKERNILKKLLDTEENELVRSMIYEIVEN